MNYDFIFENVADAICIIGKKGHIEYSNTTAKKLLFLPDIEPVGCLIWDCIPLNPTNDEFMQYFINTVLTGKIERISILNFEDCNGNVQQLRVCMVHYKDDDQKEYTIIVITNMTELLKVTDAFSRYTSKTIAHHILHDEHGDTMGGQNKNVAILMSDFRGFTALSTQISADRLVTMVNHCFEELSEIVDKYEGTIIEFLGDSLFIVFNAPNEVDHFPSKAAACALEMENRMKVINIWNEEHDYPDLQMGIGLHVGEAIVGNLGSSRRTKYGCIGKNVNLTGRLESFTVGGQIYISEDTKNLIPEDLDIAGTTSFMPKGSDHEIRAYDLKGIGAPYDIHLDKIIYDYKALDEVLHFSYCLLENKRVLRDRNYSLDLVSAGERYALIKTSDQLSVNQNILINTSKDLYAKVVDTQGDYLVICFTGGSI